MIRPFVRQFSAPNFSVFIFVLPSFVWFVYFVVLVRPSLTFFEGKIADRKIVYRLDRTLTLAATQDEMRKAGSRKQEQPRKTRNTRKKRCVRKKRKKRE